MNQDQALNVLISATRIAQTKGAYSLEDAELILKAIRVFTPSEVKSTLPDANSADTEKKD